MTRHYVEDLFLLVDAALPDNITQEISPADVRSVFKDIIDSTVPAGAMIAGTNPGVAVALTTTPQALPNIYTAQFTGSTALLEGRMANGDLLAKTSIGRLMLIFGLTMIAPSGSDIVFAVARNGVLLPPAPVFTGRGAGNPVSAQYSWLASEVAANDVFNLWAYGLTASANVTLRAAAVQGVMLPQYHI